MDVQPWHYDFNAPFHWTPAEDMVAFKDNNRNVEGLNPILKVDLVETETDFHVHADLPGVNESDLEVSIDHNKLVIVGKREYNYDVENLTSHFVERKMGTVRRAIHLPPNADQENVTANFSNGVLTVTFPKKAQNGGVKIAVTKK